MTAHWRRVLTAALVVVGAGSALSAADPVAGVQLWARYWAVPADLWAGKTTWDPPEKAGLDKRKLSDLGIAFSGGGTRSATATLGELRGLHENGWLAHVRYITAVSGGSWTSVPFVYSSRPPAVLLGKTVGHGDLTPEFLKKEPAKGTIEYAIVKSGLFASGAREVARVLTRAELAKGKQSRIPSQLQALVGRYVAGKTSQTYANMLAKIFLDPFVDNANTRRYTWDEDAFNEIKTTDRDAPLGVKDFVWTNPDRPFLIVGGTMIYQHPAYDFPRLIPVEYTPLYTGVRQQYGERLGGVYVSPYAYDAVSADKAEANRVRVTLKNEGRPFTLADVIGSSGAAPLLTLYRGVPTPAVKRGTVAFPTFSHFSVRAATGGLAATPVVPDLLHGDGGFSDNLGVMPLLARGVHNIIVFVNAAEPFAENDAVESMFFPLNKQVDTGGDRSMNGGVFGAARYWQLKKGLADAVAMGHPPIYCDTGWDVQPNEIYNVAGYKGLNICWVYNQKVEKWNETLPAGTKALLAKGKDLEHFPGFATFEENKPSLIKLHAEQVQLLSQFTSWMVTSPDGRGAIEKVMGSVLR
jgi:hypothetical protein